MNDKKIEWLKFEGNATEKGNKIELTSKDGCAVFQISKTDVIIEGENISVALESCVDIIKNPKKDDIPKLTSSFFGPEECRDQEWFCAGLIAICCQGGKVVGACIGIGGC